MAGWPCLETKAGGEEKSAIGGATVTAIGPSDWLSDGPAGYSKQRRVVNPMVARTGADHNSITQACTNWHKPLQAHSSNLLFCQRQLV